MIDNCLKCNVKFEKSISSTLDFIYEGILCKHCNVYITIILCSHSLKNVAVIFRQLNTNIQINYLFSKKQLTVNIGDSHNISYDCNFDESMLEECIIFINRYVDNIIFI